MRRTTIFADEDLFQEMQALAEREGKTFSDVIREAMTLLLSRKRGRRRALPSFAAIGRSKRSDIADRHEEMLWKDDSGR
jgi:predicted CopG family antitoxin